VPTYQYICKKCGHELEELQSISAPPLVRCPNCHTDSLARVVGAGSGLIFKGSGFYLTDYKKQREPGGKGSGTSEKKKEGKPKEKKEEPPASPPPPKSDSDTSKPPKSD
jgi:putative FmdB family regulatory protein